MRSKILRALAAAAIIGTLLLAGTAPYGPPGVRSFAALSVSGK
jgi:hypothetical protein